MNFIGQHNHLGGYQRVSTTAYGIPLWSRRESSVYTRKSFSWKWIQGSRVSTINDWLRIKIGGDEDVKRKKTNPQANRIKSTKYTLITFLPQNLLEQFQRIANFYFLVMTIISILIDSPVSPLTSLLPLVFVIAVTATKQGYEDFLRYKTDNIVNCSPVTIVRNGEEMNIECQDVTPGDLVLVMRDCDVPCDLVLLQSSDTHGKCFVTTANLDGESNLKTLTVPRGVPHLDLSQMHKLGLIECESAKTDLYSFNGKIEMTGRESRTIPLTAENILLRGSRVKNTECVIGCAVYTGMMTKLALNSQMTRNKAASSEVYINRFLLFILVGLIGIVTVLYFLKRYFELFVIPHHQYLGPASDSYSVKAFLQDYLSFLILFNYLIPISLYVTIEMHRVIGGFFMEWDKDLYDEKTDEHCIVNTSNLNEELGQVNILFSDKTGTLTKNEMIFQQCSIDGHKYHYRKTKLLDESTGALFDINKFNNKQKNFFQGLAICHTVQVAGDMMENTKTLDGKSKEVTNVNAANIYSISDITEESNNSSQQSDVDCRDNGLSFSIRKASTVVSDVNPLLDDATKPERRKRPEIVKRSPRFARATSRVYPSNNIEMVTCVGADPGPAAYPVTISYSMQKRPLTFPFKRSTSEVDLPDHGTLAADFSGYQTHRRTQSYGTPASYMSTPVNLQTSNVHRTASASSRESYALPNFVQRQPSILLRAESQRRKNEIETAVQTLDYQASSPDEKALVEACAHLGLVYVGDDDEILKIRVCPPHIDYSRPLSGSKCNEISFERLHVLEFTSDRKRMSVIVKDENGAMWIYTKGAEGYVFPLCANSSSELVFKTNQHISEFARQGLRTLAVARRKITNQEYQEFLIQLNVANSSLEQRKQLSDDCYAKIEKNLDILGATAVEDALQDEVADTLISLQKAGIKVWVLTGDKVETALNIALSCGHIPPAAMKYFIVDCNRIDDMLTHLNALDREIHFGVGRDFALLIDGKSLAIALKDTPMQFRDIAIKCTAVLCCRLSPLQKSEVVALVRTAPQNYITAAIGDGANDVSMIQEAHVGVGIMGKEGRQAARCADFAFAKFCMLKRLLLVHGHYHTTRLSFLVLYFFYKNTFFMGIMFLFQFHTMFSSSSIYDSLFLTLYNVIYTSLPIFIISLTEKPYTVERLISEPELYKENADNKQLQWQHFLAWMINAVYHSLICFYFTFYIFSLNNVILNVGQTAEFSSFGTLLIQLVVIVVNLKLALESKYLSYYYITTVVGSILAFMITTVVYNVIDLRYDTDIYWAYNRLLASIPSWLLTIVTVIACLLPDYTIKMTKQALNMPKKSFYPGARRRLKILHQRKAETSYL